MIKNTHFDESEKKVSICIRHIFLGRDIFFLFKLHSAFYTSEPRSLQSIFAMTDGRTSRRLFIVFFFFSQNSLSKTRVAHFIAISIKYFDSKWS
jgi:hypothetical protein